MLFIFVQMRKKKKKKKKRKKKEIRMQGSEGFPDNLIKPGLQTSQLLPIVLSEHDEQTPVI